MKVIYVPTGQAHRLVLRRGRAYRLEVEDAHFHHDSAVLLPDHEAIRSSDHALFEEHVSGIAALAACFRHVETHPTHAMLITGHADTTGDAAANVELSQLRADGVLAMLTGERERWVDIANRRHRVEDVQSILVWAEQHFGWRCDPGEIDDALGPRTRDALVRFQTAYNEEFTARIAVDGLLGPQTWGAVFDSYTRALAWYLDTTEDELGIKQSRLQFIDAARRAVGCGEHFPIDAALRNGYRSAANRRVEVLFFEPGELPSLACHPSSGVCRHQECELQTQRRYSIETLPVASPPWTMRLRLFDVFARPMPRSPYALSIGRKSVRGEADTDGWVTVSGPRGSQRCLLGWGRSEGTDQGDEIEYLYTSHLYIEPSKGIDGTAQACRMLHNLGLARGDDLGEAVKNLQRAHGRERTGRLSDVSADLQAWHDACAPAPRDAITPPEPPPPSDPDDVPGPPGDDQGEAE